MIQSLSILLALQLTGEILARWLSLPLPGGLIGMMILLAALLLRDGVSEEMQHTSQTLLQNLMLLFIPFIVGILDHIEHVKSQWFAFIAACIAGTVVTQIVTAWTLRWMLQWQQKKARHEQ